MKTLWLRLIYAAHMTLPLGLAIAHIERLSPDTVQRLRALFS
jgi:hypothetical protein